MVTKTSSGRWSKRAFYEWHIAVIERAPRYLAFLLDVAGCASRRPLYTSQISRPPTHLLAPSESWVWLTYWAAAAEDGAPMPASTRPGSRS